MMEAIRSYASRRRALSRSRRLGKEWERATRAMLQNSTT